ncbi:MAG: bacteriohemerythrin [Gammaproteobacteria bacterium]|nr:bacteriohemerythrin [Gammaproteobacteria bacterium]MCW9005966.1 bacteriohemerythrin [Gammaproteobacteria bacterium]
MSDVKWDKKYEIGHDRIDFEHQIFVDLVSRLDDAVHIHGDKDYIQRLLNELLAYTKFHFISEENIMISNNYPDYDEHRRHHMDLLERYNQNMMRILLDEEDMDDFIIFLKEWFIKHTVLEDKKIAKFIQKKQK